MKVKIGDLVVLHKSTRRNDKLAGKVAVIIGTLPNGNPIVYVEGKTRGVHGTQIGEVIK